MRILSYNTQIGLQGEKFFLNLLNHPCDFYCFQRFPKKWLTLSTKFSSSYCPSYDGSETGCATFSPHSVTHKTGNTLERDFTDRGQSSAYIVTQYKHVCLINTLPPYATDEVSEQEVSRHLEVVKNLATAKTLVVGDFHRDLKDTPVDYFSPFKNYANKINFYGKNSQPLNLTKLLSNIPLKLNEEQVILLKADKNVHMPVIFDFYLSDET